MFVELMPLLGSRTVLITVAKVDDNTLRVNVIPAQAKAVTQNRIFAAIMILREVPPYGLAIP
jgi:hypothetical protein